MKKYLLLVLATTMFAANVVAQTVEKTSRGVIVHMKDATNNSPKLVRLEVCGDKIIRASATPEEKFADPQSLIIVDQKSKPSFKVTNEAGVVTLTTAAVKANVNTTTGEVWFTDLLGNTYVREQLGGGKTFQPYTCTQTHADGVDETYKGWSSRVVFESPEDEAFYGLGQHQADEWNHYCPVKVD